MLSFLSCQDKSRQDHAATRNYLIEIKDDFIVNSIEEYVKEYHLNNNTTIISINVKTDTYRTSLYISHTQNDLNKFDRMPGRYTMMNGFLVLVYSDVDKFIAPTSIKEELASVILESGIRLKVTEGIDDTPSWKISKCDEHITKELEADELELPCFLKLANVDGELKIVEESWFKELKDRRGK
jgi:hypothetical protein